MNGLNLTIFHNLGSLILGLGALLLACIAIFINKTRCSSCLSASSFSLCALSLLLQIAEINRRVNLSDFSAIADTIYAVRIASTALVVLTITLNAAALVKQSRNKK